ncbi:MAG: DUF294 nucleotidyltransferase-like domain-containing protein, partial [Desulfobacterales bacterium]|nr:DUF294 nucleotidyltransferase-like domain-containing protein [Desulfobacterales bacterium]
MLPLDAITTMDELVSAVQDMDEYLHSMVRSGIPLHRILTAMSHRHEAVCGKVISLCEAEMEKNGQGRPPVAYCWVNMGSEGRREQALRTDQDNALIHADPRDGEL